jgi:hypothetical protein
LDDRGADDRFDRHPIPLPSASRGCVRRSTGRRFETAYRSSVTIRSCSAA